MTWHKSKCSSKFLRLCLAAAEYSKALYYQAVIIETLTDGGKEDWGKKSMFNYLASDLLQTISLRYANKM